MNYDFITIAKVISPLITLIIGALIRHYSERRSKLISYIGHVSTFSLNDESRTLVFTHSIIVRNAGRKTATNIRLGHNVMPPNVSLYPNIPYKIEKYTRGRSEIVIPQLVPKEQVTISYLYFPPTTLNLINSYTKSDEGFAKTYKCNSYASASKVCFVNCLVFNVCWCIIPDLLAYKACYIHNMKSQFRPSHHVKDILSI